MAFKMKAGKEGPMKKNFGGLIKSAMTGGLGIMSPMDKELVGNQKNLPEHLKKKIEAAPESPNKLKSDKYTIKDANRDREAKGKVTVELNDGKKKTKITNPNFTNKPRNKKRTPEPKINLKSIKSKKVTRSEESRQKEAMDKRIKSPNKLKSYESEREARRDSYGVRPSKGDKDFGDTARRIARAKKDKNYSSKLKSKKLGKIDVTTRRSTAVGGRLDIPRKRDLTREEKKEERKMAKIEKRRK